MSLDNEIRDALRRRAEDVTPSRDALGRIRSGAVRARTRRAVVAGALTVVALIGGTVAVTSLVGDQDPGGFVNPGPQQSVSPQPTFSRLPEPSPSDEPHPWENTRDHSDPRGFSIVYPLDFTRENFEGVVEVRPGGLPSLAKGEPTFAVTWSIHGGDLALSPCGGETGSERFRGEDVSYCQTTTSGYQRQYVFIWADHPCDHPALGCPSKDAGVTVLARIHGGNKELWDQHFDDGHAMVRWTSRSAPRPNEEAEPFGSGPRIDDAREVARSFMDARIAGAGAERWMTAIARRDSSAELYGHGSGPTDYTGWTTRREDGADANSWVFTVEIESEDGTISTEEIGIGAEPEGLRIRFVALMSRQTP